MPLQIITQESNLKFDLCYLSDGVIEVSCENEADVSIFKTINFNREEIENQLIEKGYNIVYKDYPGGHEFKVWRAALLDFLPLLWR